MSVIQSENDSVTAMNLSVKPMIKSPAVRAAVDFLERQELRKV